MKTGKRGTATTTARDPLAAERARLAAASFARGVVWAVLTVSLLGTVVTAPYLPSPWGRPVLLLALLGGLVSGLVTLYRLFIAFMALLALGRGAVPGRLGARSKPRCGARASARGVVISATADTGRSGGTQCLAGRGCETFGMAESTGLAAGTPQGDRRPTGRCQVDAQVSATPEQIGHKPQSARSSPE